MNPDYNTCQYDNCDHQTVTPYGMYCYVHQQEIDENKADYLFEQQREARLFKEY